jgi:hypothetical protein
MVVLGMVELWGRIAETTYKTNLREKCRQELIQDAIIAGGNTDVRV